MLNKRGRKSKAVNFKPVIKSLDEKNMDNSSYILHIPFIPDEFKIEQSVNNQTLTKEKKYTSNTYDITIYDIEISKTNSDNKQIIPKHTEIACWWCCHTFDTLPLHAPISYNSKKEIFNVGGIFCSFNCCKAYLFDKYPHNNRSYLEVFLRRILTGNLDNIKKAPNKSILKMFGGPITIEKFRESFTNLLHYEYSVYPMVFIPSQLKEIRSDNTNNVIKNKILETLKEKKNEPVITLDEKKISTANERISNIKKSGIKGNLAEKMNISFS